METDIRGDWMQTYTGRAFYPLTPKAEDIDPADIAHALSQICRYGGHTKVPYSVAQHCVIVSWHVPVEDALWGLLHDAAEAYLGDVIRPLKRYLPEYVDIENRLLSVVAERFEIPVGIPKSVHEVDNRILLNERDAVLGTPPQEWGSYLENLKPLPIDITPWPPYLAEHMYLERLERLHGE